METRSLRRARRIDVAGRISNASRSAFRQAARSPRSGFDDDEYGRRFGRESMINETFEYADDADVYLAGDRLPGGVINVRIGNSSLQFEVPVHDFANTTLGDVITYLRNEGEITESFFGYIVIFGGSEIPQSLMDQTLQDLDIDEDANLHVMPGQPSTREQVEAVLLDDAGGLDLAEITYDKEGRLANIELYGMGLVSLPESFGNLKLGGNLIIADNEHVRLPRSFGYLKVRGHLVLEGNNISSLPDSFGNLKVGRDLNLARNALTHLPESFGDLGVINGSLYLHSNQLSSLPESFGNLTIKETLYLHNNVLSSLPTSFGDLKVGKAHGHLHLNHNSLSHLPDSLSELDIGGHLDLRNNPLRSLPESFENLKLPGRLLLHDGQLSKLSSRPDWLEKLTKPPQATGVVRRRQLVR